MNSSGKNIHRIKIFVGENYCHLTKISSLFPDEIFSDKVYALYNKNCLCSGTLNCRWNYYIVITWGSGSGQQNIATWTLLLLRSTDDVFLSSLYLNILNSWKKHWKLDKKKIQQKVIGKPNKRSIKEDEALTKIVKKYKTTFLFVFFKNSPNRLFSRLSFFSHFSHSPD